MPREVTFHYSLECVTISFLMGCISVIGLEICDRTKSITVVSFRSEVPLFSRGAVSG